ncbi:DUF192 domain-containing protein [Qipengyuania thermophila]|uniref:DUF192 domain-containing protein n=1 Tax=Qipengyuania thermophila TaxID=2509361 RepID=UPI001F41D7D5|nr:DUF192 domain-containing protein [Qipengyuania thermophila]
MRTWHILAVAAATLALPSCYSQAAESQAPATGVAAPQASRHPLSGLEVVPLTVTSATGTHRFRVEVARTPAQQQRGLMERTSLAPDEGMIFPYNPPAMQSFWMRNTPLSLDIIFIGPDGRIINIAAQTQPLSDTPVLSDAPASLVLEIRGGRAAELGIRPGDRVEW